MQLSASSTAEMFSKNLKPTSTPPPIQKSRSHASSNADADSHTTSSSGSPDAPDAPSLSSDSSQDVDTLEEFKRDDQREHGSLSKIESAKGSANGILEKTPADTSSLLVRLCTLGKLHNTRELPLRQDGLEWERKYLELTPTWSLEPSTKALADVAANILRDLDLLSTPCLSNEPFLEFEGAFNKLYSITSNDASYLMRITLPVDPAFKTWSEVSTIAFLRANTTIPVPKIITYSSSTVNDIGFEWILMEWIPDATPMKDMWPVLSWDAKTKLVEDVADIMGQLFNIRTDTIGSIYQMEPDKASLFGLGRIVSMHFFWGDHVHLDHIPRGPFTSSRDWLHARLQLLLHDCTTLLANPDSDDLAKEDALMVQAMVHRLLKLLPIIFPVEPETFALHHGDLSHRNILLDHTGTLKAVVDWECISTMPFFTCCQVPGFLQSSNREDKPDPEIYGVPAIENSLYDEHLKDYELTQLRKHFLKYMCAKHPAWVKEYESAGVREEFEYAVTMCDDGFTMGDVEEWLDRIEGDYLRNENGGKA